MHPAKNQNQTTKMEMEMEMEMKKTETKEKEKEKIIVQGIRKDVVNGHSSSIFTVIDMAKGCVKQIPHSLYHYLNSITSIGSVIYVVGGIPTNTPEPDLDLDLDLYLDLDLESDSESESESESGGWKKSPYLFYLNLDSSGWKKSPYMLYLNSDSYSGGCGWKEIPYIPSAGNANIDFTFCSPTVVSLGGKLYAFARCSRSPSAAVFDSNTNQWETLLPPSDVAFFDVTSRDSAVADPDNNRLLVAFNTNASLYAYYPSNNKWELLVESFKCASSKPVFVKGVFYSYLPKHRHLVMAFDTVTKQRLENEFTSELPEKMWAYRHADMLYLGNGLMCLVDSSCSSFGDSPGHSVVTVAKFRFKRCTDRPLVLIITPLSVETYKLDTLSSLINYYPF